MSSKEDAGVTIEGNAMIHMDIKIALAEEVNTATFLIRQGLISLDHLHENVELAHLPILLLSNGFERLIKTIICLSCLEKNPVAPDFGNIRTHKIDELLERVIKIAKMWGYEKKCEMTKEDMVFLDNCKDLKKLVKLLTEFGDKGGRYYNIDLITGKKKKSDDPCVLFVGYFDEKIGEGVSVSDIFGHVITTLQRFARALCRMSIYGELGKAGSVMENIAVDFLYLKDEDLSHVKS